MTNTNDAYTRSVALEKAFKLYENASPPHPDTVLEAAEKFRVFLTGEVEKVTPELSNPPTLKTPRFSDEYLYFQFEDSPILYRSDLGHSSMSGGISRLNARVDKEWREIKSTEQIGTRAKIRNRDGYREISSADAARILKARVEGVRFE